MVYRVYRSTKRITAWNIHEAALLAEVAPLSGLDQVLFTTHFKGEYIDQREEPDSPIPTFCIEDGRPINMGECLYVHSTPRKQKAFYAVTMMHAGTENLAQIGDGNSLAAPMTETPAPEGSSP